MIRNEESSINKALFNGIIKLIILLIIVFILNYISPNLLDETFNSVVLFINQNLAFLVVMNLVFWIADMLFCMTIPLSLISPWINVVGAMMVITFIFKIMDLMSNLLDEPMFHSLRWLKYLIYPIAFIATLVGGYIKLLFKPAKRMAHEQQKMHKRYYDAQKNGHMQEEHDEKIIDLKMDKDSKSWGKIRKDFIQLMEDVVLSIRNGLGLNKKKRD